MSPLLCEIMETIIISMCTSHDWHSLFKFGGQGPRLVGGDTHVTQDLRNDFALLPHLVRSCSKAYVLTAS